MVSRLTESAHFRHLFTTDELDAVLSEDARLNAWLRILGALARAQSELGLIPHESARAIEDLRLDQLDGEYIAEQTRSSSHSTLGLIRAIQRALPESAREHVYFGATVQDLTDTWFALTMRDVGEIVRRNLSGFLKVAMELAREHQSTVMIGRTHGQAGAPITFGLKAATWADEVRRHIDRIDQGESRWAVAQLAGAAGAFGFFNGNGPQLRARFSYELGLQDPVISWTSTRDRIGEFGSVMAGVAATLARVGNEVYELQRTEIGELRESSGVGTVGSITMPHKRNPERAEHLDTLGRLARSAAAVLLEGMSPVHERDGRAWKAEWVALPEVALAAGTSSALAVELISGLQVDVESMRINLERGGTWASQQILAELSLLMGKHRAQDLMQRALVGEALSSIDDLVRAVSAASGLDPQLVGEWCREPDLREAVVMVQSVLASLTADHADAAHNSRATDVAAS